MKLIDDFLNTITMYRLVLYCLIFLLAVAFILSSLGFLPFSFYSLAASIAVLVSACWVTNTIFAKVFKIPTNLESVYITALILVLIITPASSIHDFIFLGWAAVLAISSKYILNISGKHLFNPAALGVTLTAFTINSSASWWVGTALMTPFTFLVGFLILKKIQRFSLALSFFTLSIITILGYQIFHGENIFDSLKRIFLDTPILFFAYIMLTEPLTSPPTKILRVIYGGLVGFLFAPFIHIGSIYFTPEISLLIGNLFSYLVSPKERLLVKLKEKIQIGPDMYDFIFEPSEKRDSLIFNGKLNYTPGQYMEWTLGHKNPDSRGSRRYFTLASSPTEGNLRIGVKIYPSPSSWKKALIGMNPGDSLIAGYLAGEFNLPKDPGKGLVFIAGGIGITPFRSIIKYLIDTNQKRDIVLLYSIKTAQEIVYKDIFEAAKNIGVKTVYITTDTMGFIDAKMISQQITDFKSRYFYISGPHSMVDAFEKTLKEMNISSSQIKIDFFPGYA